MKKAHRGYIQTPEGDWYVQIPDNSPQGFTLYDEDQSWEFPPIKDWKPISDRDVPIDVRKRLGHILEEQQ